MFRLIAITSPSRQLPDDNLPRLRRDQTPQRVRRVIAAGAIFFITPTFLLNYVAPMHKGIPLFVLCVGALLGGGCGFKTMHANVSTFEHFRLGQKGQVQAETPANPNLTEAQIQELWGQPDAKRVEPDGVVVWRYKGAVSVKGAVIGVLIIPVPLCVPTGHDYVDIYLKEGRALKVVTSQTIEKDY